MAGFNQWELWILGERRWSADAACVGGVHLVGYSAEYIVFLSYQHTVFSLVPCLGVHVGLLCLKSVGEAQHPCA